MNIIEQKVYPSYMDYRIQKSFENIDSIFDDACNKLDKLKKEFEPKVQPKRHDFDFSHHGELILSRMQAAAQNQAIGKYGFNGLYANRPPSELEIATYNPQYYGPRSSYWPVNFCGISP